MLGDWRVFAGTAGSGGAPALVCFDIWCLELLMPFERRSVELPLHHQSTDIPEKVQVLLQVQMKGGIAGGRSAHGAGVLSRAKPVFCSGNI